MPASWPAQLQQYINEESFQYEPGDTVIRTEMDSGPPKRRRRMTKSVDSYSVTITLKNQTEVLTLLNFFDSDLNGGATPFEFTNPLTGVMTTFYMGVPRISPIGGTAFLCRMEWESQP